MSKVSVFVYIIHIDDIIMLVAFNCSTTKNKISGSMSSVGLNPYKHGAPLLGHSETVQTHIRRRII